MTLSAANARSMFSGVIFDLDGTLVDSRLDFAAIRAHLNCPPDVGVLEFIDSLPASEQAAAHAVVLEYERAGAERAVWMPGARECLARLEKNGIPAAILTRNARQVARLTLDRLQGAIGCLLAREDAPPKPAPEGLLMIAKTWQLAPARLAYVGDFKYDLLAAQNAGMCGIYYDPDHTGLHSHLADVVIHHFDELSALSE